MSARIRSALAIGRRLACDFLAAVPREEAASALGCEREARGWERDELRRQLDQAQGDLQLMRAAAQEAANNRSANERRLVDQLQRLETALSTEQGLRAQAERFALEVPELRAQVLQLRSAEDSLRELQDQALAQLRERVAYEQERLKHQGEILRGVRGSLRGLDAAARDVSAAAVEVESDPLLAPALAKLRALLAAGSPS